MKVLRFIRRGIRWFWRVLRSLIGILLFVLTIQRSAYPLHINWNVVSAIVRDYQFDYVSWEINALAAKAGQVLWGVQPFLDESQRSQFVRDYMADLACLQGLEAEIQSVYLNPTVTNPDEETAALRHTRDELRSDLDDRQSLSESILEGQVAAVLVDEGFGTLGQLLPPIAMRFTRMPNLLVVSPRDHIERAVELALDPLPLETIIEVESRIEQEIQMAPLVVPLGGMALYPAMIQETTSIPWAVETFAHEWVHHYFFFFPLGQNYFTGQGLGEAVTINETAADIFGKEVVGMVLARYYPELAPSTSHRQVQYVKMPAGQIFDFGRAMHVTRVTVDKAIDEIQVMEEKAQQLRELGHEVWADAMRVLAQRYINLIEAYMEQRRQLFNANGYRIRKLNQAYFAFYGGYQAGDRPGVGGRDPIGPAVQEIREASDELHGFIVIMRNITTRDELLRVRDEMVE